ncbi:MAG: hypothetical protein ACO1RT_04800 [Planctomycetaceae bacterium]
MQYPIELRFKLMSFAQRITARDAAGQELLHIKQKMFKFKEQVEIYRDSTQKQLLFRIAADRMLDFSANYSFTDAQGNSWGGVRRQGMKSLWAAHYDVIQDGAVDMKIQEESPFKKVLESLLGEIPLVGFIAVYLLNPSYLVTSPTGEPLLRLTKKPAVFEGKFVLEKLREIPEDDELRSLLALVMVVLLERDRG